MPTSEWTVDSGHTDRYKNYGTMSRKQISNQCKPENTQFDILVENSFDLINTIGDDVGLETYFDIYAINGEIHCIMGGGFDAHLRRSPHKYYVCTDTLELMKSIHETLDTVSDNDIQQEWKTNVEGLQSELTSFIAAHKLGEPSQQSSFSHSEITDLIVHNVMQALNCSQ